MVLRDYFSMPNIDRSFKSESLDNDPQFSFKLNCIFLPKFVQSVSDDDQSLIWNHESQHAKDASEAFFLSSLFLNELIANFNFCCGSITTNDVASAPSYSYPPIYTLDKNQFQYLNCLTEGLATIDRLIKSINQPTEENVRLWKLQKQYIPKGSTYNAGTMLYYRLMDEFFTDSNLMSDVYDHSFCTLLNNILPISYYDGIIDSLDQFQEAQDGIFMPFIPQLDYGLVFEELMQLDEQKLRKVMSREHSIIIRNRIYTIYQKVYSNVELYDQSLERMKSEGYLVGGDGYLKILKNILDYSKEVQGIYLKIFERGNLLDISALRFYLGQSVTKLLQYERSLSGFYYYSTDDEIEKDPIFKTFSNEIKGHIRNLKIKKIHGQIFCNMIITYCRNHLISGNKIDCFIRGFLGPVEDSQVDGFCRGFFLEKEADPIQTNSCCYQKGEGFSKKADCAFMKILENLVETRDVKIERMYLKS